MPSGEAETLMVMPPLDNVAKAIYEAIFVDEWECVRGAERECYLQAARSVLQLLGIEWR